MTELSDYSKFAEGPMVFPYNGKKYTLPEVDIPAGMELGGVYAGTNKSLAKKGPFELFKLVLGPLWDQMIADGVPLAFATRVALTAIADHQYNREFAVLTWETNADPKALQPYLDEKAALTANRASRRSNSTAGAKKTPQRATTRATTSRSK